MFPEPVYDPPEVDSTTSLIEEVQVQHVEEKPCDPVDNERQLVDEEEVVVEHEPQSDENHVLAVTESASYTAQEDAPKKSYAYILSSQTKKAGSGPAKVYVQANTSRVGPTKTEKQTPIPVAHDPVTEPSAPSASGSVNDPQSGNAQEEGSDAVCFLLFQTRWLFLIFSSCSSNAAGLLLKNLFVIKTFTCK